MMSTTHEDNTTSDDPFYILNNGTRVPVLAFGLYKIPGTNEGEEIISSAIKSGYRHFDTASLYQNEQILGNAIRKSGIARDRFFVSSKVWNDAQKEGRSAVRDSVEKSLKLLGFVWLDLVYIHWPVPECYIETYKELQALHSEGKIRGIALSNFGIEEYQNLLRSKEMTILPTCNQIEVSPFMYRPGIIDYFEKQNIVVAASKALHRAVGMDEGAVASISRKHLVTPAQIMVRWALQKRLIVVVKTSQVQRMKENRSVLHFALSDEEMQALETLTSPEDIADRAALEIKRRNGA
ncbi:unnamed protein product [Cylindrotheca closterium]|uniref:NADP-dependent oxidoreductase domain-containing protein n=1 Tax=Cylindrotheca closterium TaxID=2856 RepID=A0AAD2CVR9_9STRA|nr:unnamed protein product [Cylindrotheca closterium]